MHTDHLHHVISMMTMMRIAYIAVDDVQIAGSWLLLRLTRCWIAVWIAVWIVADCSCCYCSLATVDKCSYYSMATTFQIVAVAAVASS